MTTAERRTAPQADAPIRDSAPGTAPDVSAGGASPVLSRRRELGDTSARSILMTVLGEFALPRQPMVCDSGCSAIQGTPV